MPHTTHAYPFEAKVGQFAAELSARFSAGSVLRSFVLVLDPSGNVTSCEFEDGTANWHKRPQELELSGSSYVFYDPLDDGLEYIWLNWHGVEQSVMERLIGQQFNLFDFQPHPMFESRVRQQLNVTDRLPLSWGVMF